MTSVSNYSDLRERSVSFGLTALVASFIFNTPLTRIPDLAVQRIDHHHRHHNLRDREDNAYLRAGFRGQIAHVDGKLFSSNRTHRDRVPSCLEDFAIINGTRGELAFRSSKSCQEN